MNHVYWRLLPHSKRPDITHRSIKTDSELLKNGPHRLVWVQKCVFFPCVQVSTKSICVSHLCLLNVLTRRTEPILSLPSNLNQCYNDCVFISIIYTLLHTEINTGDYKNTHTIVNGKISVSQTPDGWSVPALAKWKRQTHKGLTLRKRGTKPSFFAQKPLAGGWAVWSKLQSGQRIWEYSYLMQVLLKVK